MDESSALVISVSSAKTLTLSLVSLFSATPRKVQSHECRRAPATASSSAPRQDSGGLELSLQRRAPAPAADEVVVRVEAAPINPSDIGLLFGAADLETLATSRQRRAAGGDRARARACDARDGRARRPVAAGGQRRRGRRGGGRLVGRPRRRCSARRWRCSAARCTRSTAPSRTISACCCRRAPSRPKARRASSTRSPRSAWSRPCAARATRRWCTPPPHPTSARCSTASASPTASAGQHRAQARAGSDAARPRAQARVQPRRPPS